jgi:hypothetical protein
VSQWGKAPTAEAVGLHVFGSEYAGATLTGLSVPDYQLPPYSDTVERPMTAVVCPREHLEMNRVLCMTHSEPAPEREDSPGRREENDRPEIDIAPGQSDSAEQEPGVAEIRPTPSAPELAPVPDRLKN